MDSQGELEESGQVQVCQHARYLQNRLEHDLLLLELRNHFNGVRIGNVG